MEILSCFFYLNTFEKKASFFLFRNMIETHRRQSRGLSGKAPSGFLCAGPAARLRSGSWRRANETRAFPSTYVKGSEGRAPAFPAPAGPRRGAQGCCCSVCLAEGPSPRCRLGSGVLFAPFPAAGQEGRRLPASLHPSAPFALVRPPLSFPRASSPKTSAV